MRTDERGRLTSVVMMNGPTFCDRSSQLTFREAPPLSPDRVEPPWSDRKIACACASLVAGRDRSNHFHQRYRDRFALPWRNPAVGVASTSKRLSANPSCSFPLTRGFATQCQDSRRAPARRHAPLLSSQKSARLAPPGVAPPSRHPDVGRRRLRPYSPRSKSIKTASPLICLRPEPHWLRDWLRTSPLRGQRNVCVHPDEIR